MVDFPEQAYHSGFFLTEAESKLAVSRIQRDRGDVKAEVFTWSQIVHHFADLKIYGFCCMFFLLVSLIPVEAKNFDTKLFDGISFRHLSPIFCPLCKLMCTPCIILLTCRTVYKGAWGLARIRLYCSPLQYDSKV